MVTCSMVLYEENNTGLYCFQYWWHSVVDAIQSGVQNGVNNDIHCYFKIISIYSHRWRQAQAKGVGWPRQALTMPLFSLGMRLIVVLYNLFLA